MNPEAVPAVRANPSAWANPPRLERAPDGLYRYTLDQARYWAHHDAERYGRHELVAHKGDGLYTWLQGGSDWGTLRDWDQPERGAPLGWTPVERVLPSWYDPRQTATGRAVAGYANRPSPLNAAQARRLAEQYLRDVELWAKLPAGSLALRRGAADTSDGRFRFVLADHGSLPVFVAPSERPGLAHVNRQRMPVWTYDVVSGQLTEGTCAITGRTLVFYREHDATHTEPGEQHMSATETTSINNRVSAFIDRKGLKSVPEAAEALGLGKATLYGVLRFEREHTLDEPENAETVAQVLAALDAAEAEPGAATEVPAAEAATPNQEAPVASSKTSAAKTSKGGKGKGAAKTGTAKQANRTKANTAPKAPKAEKPVQLPKTTDEGALFSTGGRMQVLSETGEDLGLRSVYGPKLQADGSYTGHVVVANTVYNVALPAPAKGKRAEDGTWRVTGVKPAGRKLPETLAVTPADRAKREAAKAGKGSAAKTSKGKGEQASAAFPVGAAAKDSKAAAKTSKGKGGK